MASGRMCGTNMARRLWCRASGNNSCSKFRLLQNLVCHVYNIYNQHTKGSFAYENHKIHYTIVGIAAAPFGLHTGGFAGRRPRLYSRIHTRTHARCRGRTLGVPWISQSQYGAIVHTWINKISDKYPSVRIRKYVVMPNHIHVILCINDVDSHGRPDAAPTPTVGRIIGYFKYQTAKEMDIAGFWQRSYHDRIIRDRAEYHAIWHYIDNNPARWAEDEYNIQPRTT